MASKYPLNAVVVLVQNCSQTDVLAPYLLKKRGLFCHLVSAESPHYLHVMICSSDGTWGSLLIPHHAVCFVAYGEKSTLSGFAKGFS